MGPTVFGGPYDRDSADTPLVVIEESLTKRASDDAFLKAMLINRSQGSPRRSFAGRDVLNCQGVQVGGDGDLPRACSARFESDAMFLLLLLGRLSSVG
jgi:hypothetical protein